MSVCPIAGNAKFDHLTKGVTVRPLRYKDVFFSLQFINNQDHVIILFTYNLLLSVLMSSDDTCLTQLSVQIIIILSTFLGTSAGKTNFLPFLLPLFMILNELLIK